MTSRRVFIASAIALLVSHAAEAQPMARVGLLGDISWDPLREGLLDLGYVEGKNLVFEARRSDGRNERWPDLAAELVRLKVHVIVTGATSATLAAMRATTTVPIVMAASGEALTTGLVASLARPGGNVTGLTQLGAELAAKRLELLKELVPNLSRVAFLWNPANPAHKSHIDQAHAGREPWH